MQPFWPNAPLMGMTMGIQDKHAEDRQLVVDFLKRRDERSFLRLYDRFTPRLYRLALRLTGGHEHDAEEVVQDVWVRACRRLTDFRWESSLRTWLTGFVVNCCRERRPEMTYHPVDTEMSVAARAGEHIDLERAVAALPPGYRQVLILHDIEGYTHEEIARLCDIEPGTSKSQLARARRTLRNALRDRASMTPYKGQTDGTTRSEP